MKSILLNFAFGCSFVFAQAQSGYYFQQEVNYKIDVTLNDKNHSLSAYEEFEYINHSSQELGYLVIHLWPNAYKNAKTAMSKQQFAQGNFFMLWADQSAKGFIDSLDFQVDGQKARWDYLEDYEDIAVLYLDKPLPAGGSIKVSTPFFVKLPSGSISRMGHVGESYQITQWYPKPAVFDMNGWHEMPYLTQGEFYSEFGSFDVNITLPENYTVGATGDLQTKSEIERLDKLAAAPIPAGTGAKPGIVIQGQNKTKDSIAPASSTQLKTLHYTQKNVHDFGWFADKTWIVRKGEIELPHSKRKVTTWAMFTPGNARLWETAGIQAINDGLYYYSLWSGDYPYDVCTAVDGTISAGGGMEYPNVTIIGNSGNESQLKTVIIHEVGHNWFYGILGSNERDNAWMDEGINSFFETRTVIKTNPEMKGLSALVGNLNIGKAFGLNNYSYQYLTEELPYLLSARGSNDQPIQAESADFTSMNYGTIVYKKSAIAFNYLLNYLGEETFNACMANYFETWKFKHPGPDDIRSCFEKTSGQSLDWFFDDIITTSEHVDYKAESIHLSSGVAKLKVSNRGDIAAPFSVDVIRNGKLESRQWFDGISPFEHKTFEVISQKGDLIKLNNIDGIPEINKNNNTIKTFGVFKRSEPHTFKFLTGVDDPASSQTFWMPLVGWNDYNKWMLGLQLHNQTIPNKNYQWSVAPMFSIATKTMNGFAKIEYDNGKIGFGMWGQRFAQSNFPYNKQVVSYDVVAPYVHVKLFPDRIRKDWSGNVRVTLFSIGKMLTNEHSKFIGDYTQITPEYGSGKRLKHIRIEAHVKKTLPRAEFRFDTSFEGGDYTNYSIFHQHVLSYDWVYKGKGKRKIHSRLYFGGGEGFYLNAAGQYGGNRYDKNSPKNNAPSDYVYDGLFLGRNATDGLLSQQFMRTQGGLAAPTQQSANQHLLSLNVEIDAPARIPVSLYGGAAFLKNRDQLVTANPNYVGNTNSKLRYLWNAGVAFPIIPGIFKVYMPLLYANSIRNEVDARGLKFGETIMFELNLNLANPYNLVKTIGN